MNNSKHPEAPFWVNELLQNIRELIARVAKKTKLRKAACAVGACILLYAIVAISMSMNSPKVSFDPVKRLRDSLPVAKSPDQLAWPAYRDALVEMGLGQDDPKHKSEGAIAAMSAILPSDKDWPVASEWIAAHQPQIAALCAASKRPMFGFPVATPISDADAALFGKNTQSGGIFFGVPMDNSDVTVQPLICLLLPHLNQTSAASHLLATDMLLAVDQGNGERATRDAEAMMAISIHVQESRLWVEDLMGIKFRLRATNNIVMALEWKPSIFTDAQLKRLQMAMYLVPPALERPDFTTQRLMFEDAVQRFYTDDGHGDGRFAPQWKQMETIAFMETASAGKIYHKKEGVITKFDLIASFLSQPFAFYAIAGRKEALDHYDASMKQLTGDPNDSLSDALKAVAIADKEYVESMNAHGSRYFLEGILMPDFSKFMHLWKLDQARRDACATAIAAELYHRANKKWPESATDLAPFCNGKTPQDPWNGKPILMETDASGFRMWSVGMNGVDDHGDLAKSKKRSDDSDSEDWIWLAPRGNLARWETKN